MAAKSVCSIFRYASFKKSRQCLCIHRYMSYGKNPEYVSFTERTHTCGELRVSDVGKEVVLCGWLQYHRMGIFLLLRDWQGITQAIIPEHEKDSLMEDVSALALESVVKVTGTVRDRPAGQANTKMETGDIEVMVNSMTVLNGCKPVLPFEVQKFHQVKESLRMKHRYLDLRQSNMQRNLRLRSKIIMKMREFLCNQHSFVDVETPTLFRRTPGGAKEFVVPTHHPGKFYCLPQSPQQFKQLLMVGGIDRYFQIAKCYRDEGSRPDRQPEFTQVDIEMSFTNQESVMELVEGLVKHAWPPELGEITTPFPHLSYMEAMQRYGVDKPDTRFGMEISDITNSFKNCTIPAIKSHIDSPSGSVQAICLPQAVKYLSNKEVEQLILSSKEALPGGTVMSVKIREDGSWQGGIAKSVDDETMATVSGHLKAEAGDIVVIATGEKFDPHSVLGKLRLKSADALEVKGVSVREKDVFKFLWVDDFPLFLPKEDGTEGLESAHHPFTAAHPDDDHLLYTNPEKVRSQHYDLVLNGAEIGGGSIRIHNSKTQTYILEQILKENTSQLSHLLEALDSGCPPHGGIALGFDRLMTIICEADSIRDVIAFPKTHDGKDLMSGAPAEIGQEEMKYYHIKTTTE